MAISELIKRLISLLSAAEDFLREVTEGVRLYSTV
jgi:hypothetical protein